MLHIGVGTGGVAVGKPPPPNFGAVEVVPLPKLVLAGSSDRQPEQNCYFLYFRFVSIGEKAKRRKISGLKPPRNLDLRVP